MMKEYIKPKLIVISCEGTEICQIAPGSFRPEPVSTAIF